MDFHAPGQLFMKNTAQKGSFEGNYPRYLPLRGEQPLQNIIPSNHQHIRYKCAKFEEKPQYSKF